MGCGEGELVGAAYWEQDRFDRALVAFSQDYADQNDRDYVAMIEAIRSGRIEAADGI